MPSIKTKTSFKSGHYASGVGVKSKTRDPKCSKAMSDWKSSGTLTHDVAVILARCRNQARQQRSGIKPTRAEISKFTEKLESRAARSKISTNKDEVIFGPSKAKVIIEGDEKDQALFKKTYKSVVGKEYNEKDLASIVGATDDSKVHASLPYSGLHDSGKLIVIITNKKYSALRYIIRDGREKTIKNESFEVKPKYQGQGIGSKVFGRQVENAPKFGFERIDIVAGKYESVHREERMNGYYVWPRLGYDAKIPYSVSIELPEHMNEYRNVSDLMKTKEGRELWKEHGGQIKMEFDLTPGSTSMRVHKAYITEQRNKGKL